MNQTSSMKRRMMVCLHSVLELIIKKPRSSWKFMKNNLRQKSRLQYKKMNLLILHLLKIFLSNNNLRNRVFHLFKHNSSGKLTLSQ